MTFVGNRQQLIVVEETSYGTGGDLGTDGFFLGHHTKLSSPDLSQGWRDITPAEGGMQIQEKVVGEKAYRFNLDWVITDFRFMKFFLNLAESGTDPYTHTMTIPNTISSFKLEHSLEPNDTVITFTGCFFKNLQFNWAKPTGEGEEAFIRVTAEVVAQDFSVGSSTTDIGSNTKTPFQFRNVKITIAGTEITKVNSGDFTLDANINEDDSRYCNATLDEKIGKPIPTIFTNVFNLQVNTEDSTYIDLFNNRTEVTGTNTIEFIEDDTNNNLVIDFSKLYNMSAIPPTELRAVTKTDLLFNGVINNIVSTDNIENY